MTVGHLDNFQSGNVEGASERRLVQWKVIKERSQSAALHNIKATNPPHLPKRLMRSSWT